MMDNGSKDYLVVKGNSHGLQVKHIKEISKMEKFMVRVLSYGQMGKSTMENFKKTKSLDMVECNLKLVDKTLNSITVEQNQDLTIKKVTYATMLEVSETLCFMDMEN